MANEFYEQRCGVTNAHLLINDHRDTAVVAVTIASAKPDSVVARIAEQVKEGAKQCSGTRPALVAVRLADDIEERELQALLREPGGFHVIGGKVFEGSDRQHVDSLAIPQRLRTNDDGEIMMSGSMAAIYNPQPKFVCPEIREISRRA
jgi:hypothetical protein